MKTAKGAKTKKMKAIVWDFDKAFAEEHAEAEQAEAILPPVVVTEAEWQAWRREMDEMARQPPTDAELNDMARRFGIISKNKFTE